MFAFMVVFVATAVAFWLISYLFTTVGSTNLLNQEARAGLRVLGWFLVVLSGGSFAVAYTSLFLAIVAMISGLVMIDPGFVMTDFVLVVIITLALAGGAVTPALFYRGMKKHNSRKEALV